MQSITVIIPTLNDRDALISCLHQPALSTMHEVIVADSSQPAIILDQIPENTRIISAPLGRAIQMNAAARQATGDILLFLHADTFLPEKADSLIRYAIKKQTIAGAFNRHFIPTHPFLRWTEKIAYLRAKILFWAYGDQAIFITRKAFQQLEGYKETNHFEDLDLCIRSKKIGRHAIIRTPIETSSRRFTKALLKTILADFWTTLCYLTTRRRS